MKRFAFIFAAFAACFAVSCNKEMPESVTTPTVQDGFKTVTITANIADADTKTSYDADGKFSWTKGDQISVLASDEQVYTFTATETGASSAYFILNTTVLDFPASNTSPFLILAFK